LKVQNTCAIAWRCSLLFQAGLTALPEFGRRQPVQHEQGALDASQLLQG
jgi:hypothetical protein